MSKGYPTIVQVGCDQGCDLDGQGRARGIGIASGPAALRRLRAHASQHSADTSHGVYVEVMFRYEPDEPVGFLNATGFLHATSVADDA